MLVKAHQEMNRVFNTSLETTPEIILNLRLDPILMTTIAVANIPNRHPIIIAVRQLTPVTTLFLLNLSTR